MQKLEISISLSQTAVCDTGGNTIQAREFLFQNPCRNQRSAYGYRYRRIAPPPANDPRSAIRKFLEYLLGCGVCLFADGSCHLQKGKRRSLANTRGIFEWQSGGRLREGAQSYDSDSRMRNVDCDMDFETETPSPEWYFHLYHKPPFAIN